MNMLISLKVLNVKNRLYNLYVKGLYANHNKDRIDYVMQLYRKQICDDNPNEYLVLYRLSVHLIMPEILKPIAILGEGGRLDHLYLADIVIGSKYIIEVDGPLHCFLTDRDAIRDELTSRLGYKTIRIPTEDLSNEVIDSYLKEVYEEKD